MASPQHAARWKEHSKLPLLTSLYCVSHKEKTHQVSPPSSDRNSSQSHVLHLVTSSPSFKGVPLVYPPCRKKSLYLPGKALEVEMLIGSLLGMFSLSSLGASSSSLDRCICFLLSTSLHRWHSPYPWPTLLGYAGHADLWPSNFWGTVASSLLWLKPYYPFTFFYHFLSRSAFVHIAASDAMVPLTIIPHDSYAKSQTEARLFLSQLKPWKQRLDYHSVL